MTSAYHEGFKAFINGLGIYANPYHKANKLSKDWDIGWLDSQAVDLLKWRV